MMSKIVLLDGNSIMFRAYYATAYTGNLMKTSNDLYTNAIYGFINMMTKILTTPDMTHIFVAFDKGKHTFRHQTYQEYKGGRKPMPEEFAMQIPYIKEYLDIMNIKRLELDEFEADDLIGTMSLLAKEHFDEVDIISGDRDLLQLVRDNVKVFLTKKGITDLEEYNKDNFNSLMGFSPSQLIDYKGLIGDSSDNLPGVSGVGPKTAVKLLSSYQTVENLIDHLEELKGKLKETFEKEKEIALRTKFLATIACNAPIGYTIDDLKYVGPNTKELRKFYEKLEFQSFIKKMHFDSSENDSIEKEEQSPSDVPIHEHIHQIEETYHFLETATTFSLEIEIDQENYHKANLIGIAFSNDVDGYYLDASEIDFARLKKIIEGEKKIYTTDSKKAYVVLQKQNIQVVSFAFDYLLATYVIDPASANMDLKGSMEKYVQTKLYYHEEVYGKKDVYDVTDIEKIQKYAMMKAIYTYRAKPVMDQILIENKQQSLYYEIELPLAVVLGKVEQSGFKVSKNRLEEIGVYLTDEIKKAEESIFKIAGHEFNVASPKQLGVVLFEELKVGHFKKTKNGYSTSAEVLEKLANDYPIAKFVLDYRKYAKLYSTYVIGLLNEAKSDDSKVHTIFKQALTLTGRLSSTEPNIQNIPIRTEEGRIIRTAFIPSEEEDYLLSADYSQIELRILASMANCKAMKEAFNADVDLHALTASKVYNVEMKQVTKEMRRVAKAVNFGIVYGISDWGLAEQLHIAPSEASAFIKKYFEIYPEIKEYLNTCVETTKKTGYTLTLYNRRRYMPEINSTNAALRKFSERAAMNAPIQGTAADVMKIAMIQVQNKLDELHLKSKIVAQVHDELIIDTKKDELETIRQVVKETMEQAVSLGVKLISEVEFGKTWDLK